MVWDSLVDEADAFYFGYGDTLQDYEAALRLYKHAAKLGAIPALFKLGQMYKYGEGCIRDPKQALEWFQEGARKADNRCYGAMAILFTELEHFNNSKKCWDRFFDAIPESLPAGGRDAFPEPPGKWGWLSDYAAKYYVTCRRQEISVDRVEVIRKMYPGIRDSLIEDIKEFQRRFEESRDPNAKRALEDFEGYLREFEQRFGEKEENSV